LSRGADAAGGEVQERRQERWALALFQPYDVLVRFMA
jgi:hypothetical protein